MPPYRKYARRYTPRRSFPKKYGKKYNRKRFSKKRFARNNINTLTMRAPLASRMLRVKLPWIKTFEPNITTSGSQFYVFQGNALGPYTSTGQSGANNLNVSPGDSLPAGAVEYSNFYDRYVVNGSSIKIEAVNNASASQATGPLIRAVLLAIPYTAENAGPVSDSWNAVRDQLNGYTYEQLLAWPYAKWRMLGSNTGGASRLNFKMFRKTKYMSGIKDLRDASGFQGALSDGQITFASTSLNPSNGFIYFLKFFNTNTTTTAVVSITVRMSLYMTMFSREFNPIQTVLAPA